MSNKIYFVLSDIHSFYTEMKSSLYISGFRKQNKNHVLIICGDIFDRGPDAVKVFNFIMSIPKSRRILIRGNHEELFLSLLDKSFPDDHDFHNHTVDTFCQIAGYDTQCLRDNSNGLGEPKKYWDKIISIVKDHKITKWLKSDEWKDYYELDKYIFVHSFIPVKIKQEVLDRFGLLAYGFENPDCFEYNPDWRNGDWKEARWGCPWLQYKHGLFKPEEDNGKTLVCGHWHTADFFNRLANIPGNNYGIYFSKGIIALDAGVWTRSWFGGTRIQEHPQNVLVINKDKCYNEYGKELTEVKAIPVIETVTVD